MRGQEDKTRMQTAGVQGINLPYDAHTSTHKGADMSPRPLRALTPSVWLPEAGGPLDLTHKRMEPIQSSSFIGWPDVKRLSKRREK